MINMSDEEEIINDQAHKQLLHAISGLGKTQHIRKPTRNEPTLQHDEFHLIKASTSEVYKLKPHPVVVNDLVQILKNTKEHINIGKKLRNVAKTKRVLQKPLEKPVAERIKRTMGYENVKNKLTRWDAVVTKNRNSEQQIFPLPSETVYINTSTRGKLDLALKSDLMKQMEETDKKLAALRRQKLGDVEDPDELEEKQRVLLGKQFTREELLAKRKELSFLKMRQSQKSAKARMQNKIKSKKYHKLLKRQKLQEQLKEFELLQKTNPEAALEKLNALEKARVLERASLRHKNTGTWAKNLQVRAKYDKDARKDLAEQLQKSRELTEKVKDMQSDEEGEEEREVDGKLVNNDDEKEEKEDPLNPWIKISKKSKDCSNGEEQPGNWRKFWLERNNNEKLLQEYKKMLLNGNGQKEEEEGEKDVNYLKEEISPNQSTNSKDSDHERDPTSQKQEALIKRKRKNKKFQLQKPKPKKAYVENGWLVEEINPLEESTETLNNIFDAGEERIREQLHDKLEQLNQQAKQLNKKKTQHQKYMSFQQSDPLKNLKDLTFQSENKRPIIDEELTPNRDPPTDNTIIKKLLINSQEEKENYKNKEIKSDLEIIDPNKLANFKLKQRHVNDFEDVNNALGAVEMEEDEDEDVALAHQQLTIAEAFEDDDIVADFNKHKTEGNQLKNTELELTMPGWGSWGGPGLSEEQNSQKRQKRLVLKLAPAEKRRDENKGNVYINEEAGNQLKQHLVSDVPFPFTSQQDYEASIRAPIGRNFVTETAFRMLTRPSVITLKGQVIEPMDDSELMKKPRPLRNPVDIRIAKLNKTK